MAEDRPIGTDGYGHGHQDTLPQDHLAAEETVRTVPIGTVVTVSGRGDRAHALKYDGQPQISHMRFFERLLNEALTNVFHDDREAAATVQAINDQWDGILKHANAD